MAKRKRLIPSLLAPGYDQPGAEHPGSDPAGSALPGFAPDSAPLEVKAFLRPGLGAAPAMGAPMTPPIARVAGEAAAHAALDEMAGVLARARAEGRLVQALPLAAVDLGHLVRDRIGLDEEELAPLIASIRDHGQRMPVEVTDLGGGRYGLISGWRRMQALQRLSDQTQEPRFGTVLALLRRPAEAAEAYVAMVEENEIRLGLSYYERARIAARAVDLGVFDTEKQALQRLFAAASRARRSKIGSFLSIYRLLDAGLRFPAAIPERLGLALSRALDERPVEAAALAAELTADPAAEPGEEAARLARFVAGKPGGVRAAVAAPTRQEIRPGLFLEVTGGFTRPVLTLSGPALDPVLRDRLETWLKTGQ